MKNNYSLTCVVHIGKKILSMMKLVLSCFFAVCLLTSCNSQTEENSQARLVGGPCEGCEAVFEFGNRPLSAVDTLPDFDSGADQIKISGVIYNPDGKTPAKDVILYIYHTDENGIYTPGENATGWERRHGYNRAWLKTGADGEYAFYTIRPGVYPDRGQAAHIHPTILEPNGNYYWLEDYYFEGDSLLTKEQLTPNRPRGGTSGVLSFRQQGSLWFAERDFILGENIPNQ